MSNSRKSNTFGTSKRGYGKKRETLCPQKIPPVFSEKGVFNIDILKH